MPKLRQLRAIARLCERLPAFLSTAKDNLQTPLPRQWIDVALIQARGTMEFLSRSVPGALPKLEQESREMLAVATRVCSEALDGLRERQI